VLEPYPNLSEGQIVVTPDNKEPLDLSAVVDVLEDQVGFSPVTEVELRLRGRIARRDGRLAIEVTETRQSFEVGKYPGGKAPPEGQIIEARGRVGAPLAGRPLDLLEWSPASAPASQP
jgi:hypothetical protein